MIRFVINGIGWKAAAPAAGICAHSAGGGAAFPPTSGGLAAIWECDQLSYDPRLTTFYSPDEVDGFPLFAVFSSISDERTVEEQ